MPPRVRPRDVWLIDWNNNNYSHRHADVTADVWGHIVRWGAETESNPADIVLTGASGTLRLENRNNRYDPSSTNSDISEAQLRRPNKARLVSVVDERVAGPWTGTVSAGPSFQVPRPTEGWTPIRAGGRDYTPDTQWLFDNEHGSIAFGTTPRLPPERVPKGWGFKIVNQTGGYTVWIPWRTPLAGAFNPEDRSSTGNARLATPFYHYPTDQQQWVSPGFPWQPAAGDRLEISVVSWVQVEWEGTAQNQLGSQLTRRTQADFQLRSKHAGVYRQPKPSFTDWNGSYTRLAAFLARRIHPDLYLAELSWVSLLGIGLVRFPDQATDSEGNPRDATGQTELGFVNACARYALGWAVENRQGQVGIQSWVRNAGAPGHAGRDGWIAVDKTWKPRRADAHVELREQYVRNWLKPAVTEIVTAQALTTVASGTVNTADPQRPGERTEAPNLTARFPYGVVFPPHNDPVQQRAVVVSDNGQKPGAKTVTWVYGTSDRQAWLEISPTPGTTGDDTTYTWKIQGRVRSVQPTVSRVYANRASQALHGLVEWICPPWYTREGISHVDVQRFADRLAKPLRYFRLSFPRTHADRTVLDGISQLDAGQVVSVTFTDADNRDWTERCLLLGCRLETPNPDRTPVKTVYGLTLETDV